VPSRSSSSSTDLPAMFLSTLIKGVSS
jgi:hypothetical protein